MIADAKKFWIGTGMMIGFFVVLTLFFSPIFNGKNGLDYLDNLYNSISKGSAYYIPKIKKESEAYKGNRVTVSLKMADAKMAEQSALLFKAGGADVKTTGAGLSFTGDLGLILENSLADADAMYHNEGKKISDKYGFDERRVLFYWWKSFNEMDKDLKKQKKFKEADIVALILKKAVESSYNYYKIEPQEISDRFGIVILSLLFYVIYTLWYGFSFMFMFEGWGMRLEH